MAMVPDATCVWCQMACKRSRFLSFRCRYRPAFVAYAYPAWTSPAMPCLTSYELGCALPLWGHYARWGCSLGATWACLVTARYRPWDIR